LLFANFILKIVIVLTYIDKKLYYQNDLNELTFYGAKTMYKELDQEQKTFIKNNLAISANTLKKYTNLVSRNEKVDFRESILSNNPDYSKITDDVAESLKKDLDVILMPKFVKHEILDNKTIEMAFIDGYYKLFLKWCRGNEDLLQDFIVKVLNSMYLFTKQDKSLVQYLKMCYQRFRSSFSRNNAEQIICTPERWNNLRSSFEIKKIQNPYLSVNEVMDLMKLSKKQRLNLVRQMQTTSVIRINSLSNDQEDLIVEKSHNVIPVIDIQTAPLTELQKECVLAYMYDSWGWQTKLAGKSINPRTNKPYSKMAITNNLREAFDILREYYQKNEQ